MKATHTIKVPISYDEAYLPTPRHRKLRYRTKEETIPVEIRKVKKEDVRLAFTLSDYGHKSQYQTKIVLYDGKLYIREWRHLMNGETYHGKDGYRPLELTQLELWNPHSFDCSLSRTEVVEKVKEQAAEYLIIENQVWIQCGEPRYVIITFGLGHNHGGTGLFVETGYNPNISNSRYFNALQGKEAVKEAKRVARGRGDTDSIRLMHEMIKVHIPEIVTCNPMKEHGEGNDFLNLLDAITQNSESIAEAGILTMAAAACR